MNGNVNLWVCEKLLKLLYKNDIIYLPITERPSNLLLDSPPYWLPIFARQGSSLDATAIESESKGIKKTSDFRPLGVTHQYSRIAPTVRLARQEFKPFRSNFPPVHEARIYDDSPFFPENLYERIFPVSFLHRLIAIETIRSREKFSGRCSIWHRGRSRFRRIAGKLCASNLIVQ